METFFYKVIFNFWNLFSFYINPLWPDGRYVGLENNQPNSTQRILKS